MKEKWRSGGKLFKGPAPVDGGIYTIADVVFDPEIVINGVVGTTYLNFVEVPMLWHWSYFTPVPTPTIDSLKQILFGKGMRRTA
jgi:hypothetical protein